MDGANSVLPGLHVIAPNPVAWDGPLSLPDQLRALADRVESGEVPLRTCVVVGLETMEGDSSCAPGISLFAMGRRLLAYETVGMLHWAAHLLMH